jgi:hypothetical protein
MGDEPRKLAADCLAALGIVELPVFNACQERPQPVTILSRKVAIDGILQRSQIAPQRPPDAAAVWPLQSAMIGRKPGKHFL